MRKSVTNPQKTRRGVPRPHPSAEARRADIYDYIAVYIGERKFAPSNRDIAEHFSLSTSIVAYHLGILQRERLIAIAPHIARGLTLVAPATEEA